MTVLANFHMASDLSEWTGTVTDSGDLAWASGAGLGNTSGGASLLIDDTNSIYLDWLNDTQVTTGKLRIRFYIDPNSLTMGAGNEFEILDVWQGDEAQRLYALYLAMSGGNYSLNQGIVSDGGGTSWGNYYSLGGDSPHYVEIYLQRASSSTSNDGSVQLWIDGTSKETLSGKDNYDQMVNWQNIRLGAVVNVPGTVSGTFFVDEFVANDDGSLIGENSTAVDLTLNDSSVISQVDEISTTKTIVGFKYPVSDSSVGLWSNELGGTTNLYESVNDSSDSDYIVSDMNPSSSPVVLKLDNMSDPELSHSHSLFYRYGKLPTNGGTINLTVELRQDYINESSPGTLIAQWSHTGISATLGTVQQDLTSTQTDSITNYNSLYVRMVATWQQ